MNIPFSLRQALLAAMLLFSSQSFSQIDSNKLKATWDIRNFEAEADTERARQAARDMQGHSFSFANGELIIAKRMGQTDSVIKRGPYVFSGNSITLGNSKATVLLLSDTQLNIQLPGQGTLYLVRR